MEFLLEGKNLYIVNKNVQSMNSIELGNGILHFYDADKRELTRGKIDLSQEVVASLYCKELRIMVFIVRTDEVWKATLKLAEDNKFENLIQVIAEVTEVTEQNAKINGYANSIIEKLRAGIEVSIMETKQEKSLYCSVCGMQCDPNIPYCMECGAPV